jgi:hypothetical protein
LFNTICVYAQEVITSYDKDTLPVLNEMLRKTYESIDILENADATLDATSSNFTGIVPLSKGGTQAALTDPNADRIMFWDDSDGETDWLVPNTGLEISGNNLNVTVTNDIELIASGSLSSEKVSITQTISAGNVYKLIFEGRCDSDLGGLWLRFNGAGSGSNNYVYVQGGSSEGNADQIILTESTDIPANTNLFAEIVITARDSDSQAYWNIKSSGTTTAQCLSWDGQGNYSGGTPTSVQFGDIDGSYSGAISGTYRFYKLNN